MEERKALWESRGRGDEEREGLCGCSAGSNIDTSQTNGA